MDFLFIYFFFYHYDNGNLVFCLEIAESKTLNSQVIYVNSVNDNFFIFVTVLLVCCGRE